MTFGLHKIPKPIWLRQGAKHLVCTSYPNPKPIWFGQGAKHLASTRYPKPFGSDRVQNIWFVQGAPSKASVQHICLSIVQGPLYRMNAAFTVQGPLPSKSHLHRAGHNNPHLLDAPLGRRVGMLCSHLHTLGNTWAHSVATALSGPHPSIALTPSQAHVLITATVPVPYAEPPSLSWSFPMPAQNE